MRNVMRAHMFAMPVLQGDWLLQSAASSKLGRQVSSWPLAEGILAL